MAFTEFIKNGVVFRGAEEFNAAGGVRHGFSTRFGGISTGIWASMNLGTTRGDDPDCVRENYRRFCAAVGTDVNSVVMSNQVHGNEVRAVTAADSKRDLYDPEGYSADGLITDIPGVALTIFSADCIPVLLYDPVRRVIAAVHAGWMGTALGIAARAAEKMVSVYGSSSSDILAAIGPGISRCCFETHEDVPNAMTEALGAKAQPCIEALGAGKYKVDLKGLNSLWLKQAGVLPGHIAVDTDCTLCHPEKYWSHRAHREHRGSQAAMIQLTV
jgi:YfiH family protein